MSVPDRIYQAARAVVELSRKLDVAVEDMTGSLFRKHGGSYSNGDWGDIYAQAVRQGLRDRSLPQGHSLGGQSEMLRTPDGGILWVKSTPEDKRLAYCTRLMEAAANIKSLKPRKAPSLSDSADDYAAAYMLGDHHVGQYCAARIGGEQWGRAEAVAMGQAAIDYLVDAGKPAGTAVLVDLGDMVHCTSQAPSTVKGTPVDVDGLPWEACEDALKLKFYMIERLLTRHKTVHVYTCPDNHAGGTGLMLALAVSARFADEPRVIVDAPKGGMVNPEYVSTFEFGKVLLAFAHGHQMKIKDVLPVVSDEYPEAWGRTRHRHAKGGHTHHYESDAQPGGQWETYPVLGPGDAWHQSQKWRSQRQMHRVRYHREHGYVDRAIASAAMLRALMDETARMLRAGAA